MTAQIIIVNYNSGAWLARSVASAVDKSDAKVTVVDNASTDNSIELAQREVDHHAERVSWVLNSENLGFAAANNQVLNALTDQGDDDFAVLMNPDCELHSDTLTLMFDAFNEHPEFGLASCRILNEDGTLQATCRRKFPTPWSALVRMLQLNRLLPNNPKFANFDYGNTVDQSESASQVEAISGAFMVVRGSALQQVGPLDEGYFMHCEDLDWCKRFALEGWAVGFVPEAAVLHAKGVSSKSRPIGVLWTLHKGMNRFFDKFYAGDTNWLVRWTVKLGIHASFVARAALTLIKSVVASLGARK